MYRIPGTNLLFSPPDSQHHHHSKIFELSKTFFLSQRYHQFYLSNLWNVGLCLQAPYISEQLLINHTFLLLLRAKMVILSFIHNLQVDLPKDLERVRGLTSQRTRMSNNFCTSLALICDFGLKLCAKNPANELDRKLCFTRLCTSW